MRVYTSRFTNPSLKERGDLVKVGIARKNPWFKIPYRIDAKVDGLAPRQWMLEQEKSGSLNEAGFVLAYRSHLDSLGFAAVWRELATLSRAHDDRDLVLLCWEDLRSGEKYCHRRILADWLLERGGVEAADLEPLGPRHEPREETEPSVRQLTLL